MVAKSLFLLPFSSGCRCVRYVSRLPSDPRNLHLHVKRLHFSLNKNKDMRTATFLTLFSILEEILKTLTKKRSLTSLKGITALALFRARIENTVNTPSAKNFSNRNRQVISKLTNEK